MGGHLRSGATASCGCLRVEQTRHRFTTHGRSHSKAHDTWRNMKARCLNHANTSYVDYGARGITVCDQWKESFTCFLADMGDPPSLWHSIERLDNERGYFPDNCVWATKTVQAQNTRRSCRVTLFGEQKTLSAWGRDPLCAVDTATMRFRIRAGWDPHIAFAMPARKKAA